MRPALEHVGTTGGLSWKRHLYRTSRFRFSWHFHPEVELTLITAGTGTRYAGDSIEPYDPGQLTLFGAGVPHAFVSAAPGHHEAVVIHFRPDFLGPGLFDVPEFAAVGALLARAGRGLELPAPEPAVRRLVALTERSGADGTLGLLDVLVRLADGAPGRPLASPGYRSPDRPDGRRRMDDVFGFLHAEYGEPITLGDVAAVAHLSPAAFSRFFRRATGRTFTAYLTELRVGAACRLLTDSDRAVSDIAASCGFANLSNFNRRFRELKAMTPREYRARFG
ncbi:AraC family transcriptional regulator [Jiangella rhizosphaerae]|uniref:AraC family transcriptional regulator n=1 Tax=Jiangella rhizosphaerae TaxID=2293569 RepID=A0A418KU25_9ACTN|nr:AraC family transcriptional regulator [Jiangella rhizosphaerae]RIQ30111.1 AraC family transcriptional regulator [Jiangella rhizosphaerae]